MRGTLHILMVAVLFVGLLPAISYSQSDDYYSNEDYSDTYHGFSNNDGYASEANYADNFDSYNNDNYGGEQYYARPSHHHHSHSSHYKNTSGRLASSISPPGEKVVIVDPRVHAWGAYDAQGHLIREGLASAGSSWCRDLHRSCHTSVGTFRIISLGDSGCVSRKFPLGRGGAPMPYCMYFNRNQALHGSYELANANISHGCVRMRVDDAEWLRFNFVHVGTKVIIRSY